MTARPWYRRFGGDFVMGTMALTLEEKGAYSLCLDLMYDRGGPIPDDARWLAGICGVSLRKWNALRERLIELGKLVAVDGKLLNPRAQREIAEQQKTSRKHAENGAKGGRNSRENAPQHNENNDIAEAGLKPRARVPLPEYSVSNETAAESAACRAPDGGADQQETPGVIDPNRDSWARAGRLLGKKRSLFGKILRDYRLEARDMLPSLVACELRGTPEPEGYLHRAAQAIAERRGQGPPAVVFQPVTDWPDERWRLALEVLNDSGLWADEWGPKPGEPGCKVPAHLLLGAVA